MRDKLNCDGVNLINACEPAAWQTVWHFHMHVIPRYLDDPMELPVRPQPGDLDEITAVAGQIRG
jgi:histidine triad (HIT) family protein